MKKTLAFIFLIILSAPIHMDLNAQAAVVRSEQIEVFGGIEYYIHTVESKQTPFGIAQAYGISLDKLLEANPEARSGLRINQILRIPVNVDQGQSQTKIVQSEQKDKASEQQSFIYHIASRNERFSAIGNKYQVPESDIRMANPTLHEPLREGEYVKVPLGKMNRSGLDLIPVKQDVLKKQQSSTAPRETDNFPETDQPIGRPVYEPHDTNQIIHQPKKAPEDSSKEPDQILVQNISKHHTVLAKETLYSISQQYDVDMDQLLAYNPGAGTTLAIGQIIQIPDPSPEEDGVIQTDTSEFIMHRVKKGETLYRIARDYATSIFDLKKLNPGLTDQISIGQEIRIAKKDITSPFIIHIVEERTRSRAMAREFEISINRFYEFNPAVGRLVYPGQVIRIPIADHLKIRPVIEMKSDSLQIKVPEEEAIIEKLVTCPDHPAYTSQKFRIALMIPLHLNEAALISSDFNSDPESLLNHRSFSFLPFYEGFMMAVDSLVNTEGMDIELYVYDVDQSPETISKALNDPKLLGVDLIVGPFFGRGFERAARFARDHDIPIVNPLSPRPGIIKGFPNVFKVKPAKDCQYEQLAALITNYYPDARVFIYRAHQFTALDESMKLRTALLKHLEPTVAIPNQRLFKLATDRSRDLNPDKRLIQEITIENQRFSTDQLKRDIDLTTVFDNSVTEFIYVNDSVREFSKRASTVRDNVVIAITDDNVFAMELVNKLNQVADTFNIRLVGLPNWREFSNLFTESLLKMNAHHLTTEHIDHNSLQIEQFVYTYRNKYNAEPAHYAFEGFDIGWFFLRALMHYGDKLLDCVQHFDPELTTTRFRFDRNNDQDGFENCYWNFYRYQNYQLVPLENNFLAP